MISVPLHQGGCWNIFLFRIFECLCVLFEIGFSRAFIVLIIVAFLSTVVASSVIQISPGSLLLLFSAAFVVPSFPALLKHDMVAESVGLRIYIRAISRLIV